MTRRPIAALALVLLLALAGCAIGYQSDVDTTEPTTPAEDHLGYYDGYWYNDTFDIDADDGITAAHEEAVFSRAMARIQLLRGLRFDDDVEIEIVTRETFRENFDNVWGEPTAERRQLDNAQYEALFLVGPDEDVFEVRRNNQGDVVLGFYQPSEKRLVIVSGNDPATLDDEITLAHELVHALQDQRFGLASFDDSTLDSISARNGLVEGDATIVERAYERNCETGEWECVEVQTAGNSGLPPDFNWGVYFLDFFPYAEGPGFVGYHRDSGGWAAVDPIYDDVPTASAEIIHPETYGTESYGGASLEDRNDQDWERIVVENGSDAATVGQAGLTSMFVHTAYDDDSTGVVDEDEFRNEGSDGIDPERPFAYDIVYANGWRADRLHAYERDGERDNEALAYVWNVTFEDAENATAFFEGYRRVAEYWGGDRRESTAGTVWLFDDSDGPFRGSVWAQRDGNAVTIVKAPSEDELDDVYAPASAG